MSTAWDPNQYLRFEDERSRPFGDLLARIRVDNPASVVDLGCGPGTATATLVDRWPKATITGVDSSPQMIDKAKALEIAGKLEFRLGDVREWETDQPVDVLVTNATLQWVPGHVDLFPRFMGSLAPGGFFAFQVPGNFDQPSHTLIHELAGSERWMGTLGEAVESIPRSCEPAVYLEALLRESPEADVWETTYYHVLHGPDAVLQWVSGTGLRPVLAALDAGPAEDKEEFLSSYAAGLRAAYPPDSQGRTVFPFRRLFAVARAPGH